MFDIGFWELALIGVIALLVVGPERLPGMARNVGLWVGRIRRYVSHVRDDIEREIRAEELRELMKESSQLESLDEDLREARTSLDEVKRDIEDADASLSQKDGGRQTDTRSAVDDATGKVGEAITGERTDDRRKREGPPGGETTGGGSAEDERQSG